MQDSTSRYTSVDPSKSPIRPDMNKWVTRTDGAPMFYDSEVHYIAAGSGIGKTMLACHIIKESRSAVYIDFEDPSGTVLPTRLRQMGMTDAELANPERVLWLRPTEPVDLEYIATPEGLSRFVGEMVPWAPIIIDNLTAAMTLHGLDPNSNKDVALFHQQFLAPLAAGLCDPEGNRDPDDMTNMTSAVIVLDHIPKSGSNATQFAFGAQHKRAAAGVTYTLKRIKPIEPGSEGLIRIRVSKDRHGLVQAAATGNMPRHFADFHVASTNGKLTTFIDPPAALTGSPSLEAPRPDGLMVTISEWLETNPDASYNGVVKATKKSRDQCRLALDLLVAEDYVDRDQSRNAHRHRNIRPYQGKQDENTPTGLTGLDWSPTGPEDRTGTGLSGLSPLKGETGDQSEDRREDLAEVPW